MGNVNNITDGLITPPTSIEVEDVLTKTNKNIGFPREGLMTFVVQEDDDTNDVDDNNRFTSLTNNLNNNNNFVNYSPCLFACSVISNVELNSICKRIDPTKHKRGQKHNGLTHIPKKITVLSVISKDTI